MSKREYTRSDERRLNVSQANDLFVSGDFKEDNSGDLFTEEQLELFLDNMMNGHPLPIFGAREDEYGCPHFKSGKFRQVVEGAIKRADSGQYSPLKSRKLKISTYIPFVTVSEAPLYNPGITRDEINTVLTFYL